MKSILRNTFIYFLFGATVTGSVYKLIYNPENEKVATLVTVNIAMLILGFILSYLGHLADRRKHQNRD